MLTQFQTTEQQAALLAACPRPRALAGAATASVALWAAPAIATAPAAGISFGPGSGSAAEVRPSASERPAFGGATPLGYGLRGVERAGVPAVAAMRVATAGIGSVKQQDVTQQDQFDHLNLNRREPRTWRPPH